MKRRQELVPELWDLKTWEKNAKEAKKLRVVFASTRKRKPIANVHKNIRRLIGLLAEIDVVTGQTGFYPNVQQALLDRADELYAAVVGGAFPDWNKKARVPSKAVLKIRYREARSLLGMTPVLERVVREHREGGKVKTTFANFSARRRRLAELWIGASAPLDATPNQIAAAILRCRSMMEKQGDFTRPADKAERHHRVGKRARLAVPTAENARELVGLLYGVAPTTVKKEIGRREKTCQRAQPPRKRRRPPRP